MYNDSFNFRCKNGPLAIDIRYEPNYTNPHLHKEMEIIYVEKGSTEVKIGAHSFKASAGDIIIANPMEVHSLCADKSGEYIHYCICFDVILLSVKKLPGSLMTGANRVTHIVRSKAGAEIFKRLFDTAQKDGETLELEASAYISLLFAEFIKQGMLKEVTKPDKSSMFYTKVMEYISENFSHNITSADVAREFFYTQSHFCRSFVNKFGTTFSEFLNIYRISKAKEMLEHSNVKISDVAEDCGFGSLNYFSKCFKKQVGMTPSEYQKYQYITN